MNNKLPINAAIINSNRLPLSLNKGYEGSEIVFNVAEVN